MYIYLPTETTVTLEALPEGVTGVRKTLSIMARFARQGRATLRVRELSMGLTSHLWQKDWASEVRALHAYVRDRIRYVRDGVDVEVVQTPEKTLELGAGDCDDKSTLLASMLMSIGHPARFVAVGMKPGSYSHVFVETRLGSRWIALETTEPVEVGWSPPGTRSRLEFSIK
jgi:hypothetical protein